MADRVVIVGAGPAGLATARSYREHGGGGTVTLVGEEEVPPYRRPPLTKELLRGELRSSELPIEREVWFERHAVECVRGCPVEGIDPRAGTVLLADGVTLDADAIVLATGSEPVRPPLPGLDDGRVLTIRAVGDALALRDRFADAARTLVIGTGFIGCEIAGSLARAGRPVVLIGSERLPQEARLGEDVGERIRGWLEDLGVELRLGASVAAVEDARTVVLESGEQLAGDCVVLGMGARPRGLLAERAGLATSSGAVLVDAGMRCDPAGIADVLAVGDVACAHNLCAQRRLRVEHWGDALSHGEVAGRTLARGDGAWAQVPGFWSVIGSNTVKYAAWGDGHDEIRFSDRGGGAFTASYSLRGVLVGVLSHECDEHYERGARQIAVGASQP